MAERLYFDPDRGMREVVDEVQVQVTQTTGEVPHLPVVTGPDGRVHELVEEDIRGVDGREWPHPTNQVEKDGDIYGKNSN